MRWSTHSPAPILTSYIGQVASDTDLTDGCTFASSSPSFRRLVVTRADDEVGKSPFPTDVRLFQFSVALLFCFISLLSDDDDDDEVDGLSEISRIL